MDTLKTIVIVVITAAICLVGHTAYEDHQEEVRKAELEILRFNASIENEDFSYILRD